MSNRINIVSKLSIKSQTWNFCIIFAGNFVKTDQKMNFKKYPLTLLAAACLVSACAVEQTESSNEDDKAYLEAWLHVHYPDIAATGSGIYILDEDINEDTEALGTSGYAFVTYTTSGLDGNITDTSDSLVAKQLGSSYYDKSYYYGPRVWTLGADRIYKGVTDMLADMTIGSDRTALIPGWLLTLRSFGTLDEYIETITGNSPVIYTVHVHGKTDDIIQWQLDSLDRFSDLYLDGMDSTSYGFYYKQLKKPLDDTDLHKDTTIYINYTGRLLNGQVFDTTIKDTAKVHNIYSPSRVYEPISILMNAEMSEITMSSSSESSGSTPITGFCQTLWQMGPMEKGAGIFYSGLGYGASGSGSSIPEYAPLIFEIELVEQPEE